MWTTRSRYTVMAAAILAAACGGGGDGGGVQETPPPGFVRISATNQDTVARASIASILPFVSVPVLSTSPSPVRVTTAQASGAHEHGNLMSLALRSIGWGTKPGTSDVVRALTELPLQPQPCAVSGSISGTWYDNDDSRTLNAGDKLSLMFNQCSDWPGESVNGGLDMSIATYSQTPASADMSGSMVFKSLVMVDQAVTLSMNGGIDYRLNETRTSDGTTDLYTYTVASGGLTVADTGSAVGFSDTFSYRAGYVVTERDFTPSSPGMPSTEELTANGDFGSQVLGGDLRLTTPQPFKSTYLNTAGDIFPSEGQMTATGLDNTKIGLSATNTSQVRMDMCDDGDNVWEATKMVEWSWLMQ